MVTYRRLLGMALMAMLVFPMLGFIGPQYTLVDRVETIPQPAHYWHGFKNHEWQPVIEQRFLSHIGSLRAFLVLFYNEAKHFLFRSRPNDHYIWTPELGYYPVDTIRRLNYDVLNRENVKLHYQNAARRLKILQALLDNHGVALLTVIAPPKVRVYPEYAAAYLSSPAETVMKRAISYGDVLEASGVNVLNVERQFTEKKGSSQWPFFTTTSFHWSFWAGCNVTNDIMLKGMELTGHPFFTVDCSDVEHGKSKNADVDIAYILNIFSVDKIIGDAPFPKIAPYQKPLGEIPKIGIIGDSFSDQIVYALTHTLPDMRWTPGWLTRYDGFASRQAFGMDGKCTNTVIQHNEALSEILTKDLLVIEVSDGPIYRNSADLNGMEFGSTRILIEGLLKENNTGKIDLSKLLLKGWHSIDNTNWRTTGHSASIAIRPQNSGKPMHMSLDIENLDVKKNALHAFNILVDGQAIYEASISRGRSILNITIPGDFKYQDPLVAEVSLKKADGLPLNIILHGGHIVLDAQDGSIKKPIRSKGARTQKLDNNNILRSINLISSDTHNDVLVEGLSNLEGNAKENWRWALGPATRIKFYVDPSLSDIERQILFHFAFKNGASIPNQSVTVSLNGEKVQYFSPKGVGTHQLIDAEVALVARKGINVLDIDYNDWNHGKRVYAAHDPRALAVVFMKFSIAGANQ